MRDGSYFVKLLESEASLDILRHPKAFALLTLVALRAYKGTGLNAKGLDRGQAFIGDQERCGLTSREYRTAKAQLSKWRLATFQGTSRGTIATLVPNGIYDISREASGRSNDRRPTIRHPAPGEVGDNTRRVSQNSDTEMIEEGKKGEGSSTTVSASIPHMVSNSSASSGSQPVVQLSHRTDWATEGAL